MASPTSLAIRHVFGVNTNVVGNGCFTDEDELTYVAGN